MQSCASESKTCSGFKAGTSAERSPCKSIKPTMAKSRAVWKLEARHFIDGERHDVELRLLHSQSAESREHFMGVPAVI
jgi:hypothetical protein